ncbi:unnamed protein product [Bubo scandiacus]
MHSTIAPSLRDAAQQRQFHFPTKPPRSHVCLHFRVSERDKLVKKDTSKVGSYKNSTVSRIKNKCIEDGPLSSVLRGNHGRGLIALSRREDFYKTPSYEEPDGRTVSFSSATQYIMHLKYTIQVIKYMKELSTS